MQVNIQMPEGTELEETIAAADEVMDRVLEIDEVAWPVRMGTFCAGR